MYTQHHQIVKPTHTTSDYYSNSSKHEEGYITFLYLKQRKKNLGIFFLS